MAELLLSVIVPVYRAENYIERCVSSILVQPVSGMEIILVDDGSPDRSGALCDRLAGQDGRVRVLHQKNAGASAARNAGIEAARGRYIQFVDADDWLAPDYSAELLRAAEQTGAELVIAGYTTCVAERQIPTAPTDRGCCPISYIAKHFERLYCQVLLNSPVNKLYQKDRLHVRFPEGMRMGEDFVFNMSYLQNTETVVWSGCAGYFYDKSNETSATARRIYSTLDDVVRYADAAKGFLYSCLPDQEHEAAYSLILFLRFCTYLNSLAAQDRRDEFLAALGDPAIQKQLGQVRAASLPPFKRAAFFLMRRRMGRILWKLMRGSG